MPRRPRWLVAKEGTRHAGAAMLLWGLAAALVTTLVLVQITPSVWPTTDGRGAALRESVAVLEHGGPLLVGRSKGAAGVYHQIDKGDDEGEYVYVPVLSRLFQVSDPLVMLRDLYIAIIAATAAFYPLIFYRLTWSLLAGAAAPFIFLVCVISMGFLDIYWIPAWGALALLPLVFLLARDWPRFGILAVAGITLAASWMSSIRSDSGLGIAVAASAVLLLRRWRWWRLLPALAALAVIYISVNTFGITAVRAARDHRIGRAASAKLEVTTAHTFWHTAYAGLGYLPNRYGLIFSDGTPDAVVHREAPGTIFLSHRYEAVVRKAFLRFVREHPLEAARQYGAKMVVVIADTTPYLLIVLLTLPAMLLVGPDRRIVRRWVLLTVPALIVAFLPVMMAIPLEPYEQGLYGVIGVLGVLGLSWMLKRVEDVFREGGGLRSMLVAATIGHRAAPGWRSARIGISAVMALIAASFGGYFVREDANRWYGAQSGALMELYPFRE